MVANFEQILRKRLGKPSTWHFVMISTLLTSSYIPLEFVAQFIFLLPEHYCRQPHLSNSSWSRKEIVNFSVPYKKDPDSAPMIGQAYYPCTEFKLDALWPSITPNTTFNEALELRSTLQNNLSTQTCRNGIEFDPQTSPINGGFAEEFEIVCDRQYFIPLSNTIFAIGMLFSYIVSGPLADRLGRRILVLTMPAVSCVSGLVTALSVNMWMFAILRFLSAISNTISFVISIVLVSEWTTASQRSVIGWFRKGIVVVMLRCVLITTFYVLPSWRWAYAVNFLANLLAIVGIFTWFESPRWLLSQGRVEEAYEAILKAMKWNRRPISPEEMETLKEELSAIASKTTNSESQLPVHRSTKDTSSGDVTYGSKNGFFTNISFAFKVRKFRVRLALLSIIWCAHMLVEFGLSFNAVRLDANPFVVALFTTIVTIPGSFLQYLLYRFFDRKWPITGLYSLCSLVLLIAFLVTLSGNRGIAVVCLCTVGLLIASTLCTMIYTRTPEVFPTKFRSIGMGLCGAASRVGLIMGVYVERLDEMVWPPLPLLIFCLASATAAMASALLPGGYGEMEEESETFVEERVNEEREAMMEEGTNEV